MEIASWLDMIPVWAYALAAVVVLLAVAKLIDIILFKFDADAQNQEALNTYLSSNLSGPEIGRFYERYIGHLFEKEGHEVEYHGATKGYEDLGRDLIVKKGNETWIIQAKCWAKQKQIHEKHIFQLYGSLEYYKRRENATNVKAVFYTTASYSQRAQDAARLLGVELRHERLNRSYPMIKCVVSSITGEKVYRLPFDDIYDAINVKPQNGEFFARTVHEARKKGFRGARLYRRVG